MPKTRGGNLSAPIVLSTSALGQHPTLTKQPGTSSVPGDARGLFSVTLCLW